MKILLDECLPVGFRHAFPNHEVHSAEWAGLKGKENGELLRAAEESGYEVLLTVDQGLPQHQRPVEQRLAIVLLRARTNQLEDLVPLVEEIINVLQSIQPGDIIRVPKVT